MRRPDRKQVGGILIAVLLIVGLAILIQTLGLRERRMAGSAPVVSAEQAAAGNRQNWNKLTVILDNIAANYVDTLDAAKVTEDILPLILSQLDPHSVYLSPKDLQSADESLMGEFFGIGIQFTVPEDTAVVSNVVSGGPAEKVGILSGDRIVQVDDTPIAGVKMPQDSMVRLMRGPKNTHVRIGVLREGESVSFDIVRSKISEKSVDVAFMVNDTTGYIKLSKFTRTSYSEFLKAAVELRAEGMTRLLFDLRGNSGGYMDQALLMCNEFLEQGQLVVYLEGAHRKREDFKADGRGHLRDINLAVLIDENSASSSEIFAGAMQDNDRGTIYGLRSFGKGLVQEPIYFTDGSGIRVTVARYHTPTGRCIQKPYSDDYAYDIYDRYLHGEMMSADSIKVNDSLKFVTPGGKVVYGGGGIIPDVFVPLDTTQVTDFLVKCNRQSLQYKFVTQFSDAHRARLRGITTREALDAFLKTLDLKREFLAFTAARGLSPTAKEWAVSGDLMLTQLRAMIGRATPLDDLGFYPIYLTIDRTAQVALRDAPSSL